MGLPQFEMHTSKGRDQRRKMLSETAGSPESIENKNSAIRLEIILQFQPQNQEKSSHPAFGSCQWDAVVIRNVGYKGDS